MSYAVQVVDMQGAKVADKAMPADIFSDDAVNQGLVHEYVVMYLANQRQSTAHTKTRSEITKSGRKLHRQKGTGRARVGDAGSPIRRKGGVVFGPRNTRIWTKSMPQKMRTKALCSALTLKLGAEQVKGLDAYTTQTSKTKEAVQTLHNMGIEDMRVLLVFAEKDAAAERAFRNIPGVAYTTAHRLNAYEVMSTKQLIFVGDALDKLVDRVTQ